MEFIVYGSEFCPRCDKVKEHLKEQGHTVYASDMEQMIEADDSWRDRWPECGEVQADNAIRNLELPSIRCLTTGEWLDFEDVADES